MAAAPVPPAEELNVHAHTTNLGKKLPEPISFGVEEVQERTVVQLEQEKHQARYFSSALS